MLGRRFVTRLTRLGLASYILSMCMSFTVCAQENPIADMAVAGVVEMASGIESEEIITPDDELLLSEDDGMIMTDEDAQLPEAEELISLFDDEETGKGEDIGGGGNGENEVVPDNNSNSSAVANNTKPSNITDISNSTSENGSSPYNEISSTKVESLSIFWDDRNVTGGMIPSAVRPGQKLVLTISSDQQVEGFDAGKLLFIFDDLSTEISDDGNVTCETESVDGAVKVTLSFENLTLPGQYDLQAAVYYTDGGELSRESTVEFMVDVVDHNKFYIYDGTNTTLYGPDHMTAPLSAKNRYNNKISNDDPKLSWKMRETGTTELKDNLYGVVIEKNEDQILLNMENATRSFEFDLIALYQESEEPEVPPLYDVTRAVVYVPVTVQMNAYSSIGNITGEPESTIRLDQEGNISSSSSFKLLLQPANPDTFDQSRISWDVLEDSAPVNLTDRGILFQTSSVLDGETHEYRDFPYISFENLTSSGTFEFRATYNNSFRMAHGDIMTLNSSAVSCIVSVKVAEIPEYCYDVTEIYVSGMMNNATLTDKSIPYTLEIDSAESASLETITRDKLDPSRIMWGLTNTNSSYPIKGELYGVRIFPDESDPLEATLSIKNVETNTELDVVVAYQNNVNSSSSEIVWRSHVYVEAEGPFDAIQAHLPKKSAKIDLYRTENKLPISVRSTDASKTIGNYEIVSVDFANTSMTSPLEIALLDDGKTININTTESFVNYGGSYFKEFLGTTVKTKLLVEIALEGTSETKFIETETLTMTFKAGKPSVKAAKTLVFNSFNAGLEGKSVQFTGAEVGNITVLDSSKLPKGIIVDSDTNTINTTFSLSDKAVKKGKFNVIAFINDSRYILPDNYNVTVPITYSVQKKAPSIGLKTKKVNLNKLYTDFKVFGFTIKNGDENTNISFVLKDSKNRPINIPLMNWENTSSPIYYEGSNNETFGVVMMAPANKSVYGATYKLSMIPRNIINNRTGSAQTITIKVLSAKDAKKAGFAVSGKGDLDLNRPGAAVTRTIKAKNICGDAYVWDVINTTVGNESIKDYLDYDYNNATGKFSMYENDETSFNLLKGGYTGKTAVTKVMFTHVEFGYNFTVKFSTKLTASKVQAKLGGKQTAIHPMFDSETEIEIPVTNLPQGVYDYNVSIDVGSPKGLPSGNWTIPSVFSYTVGECTVGSAARDAIVIIPDPSALSYYAGSTASVKITPLYPSAVNATLKATSATFKVKILNPVDKKTKKPIVSMTAKTKGNIDAIRDNTVATVALSLKNVKDPTRTFEDSNTSYSIYKETGKGKKAKRISCDELFDVECYDNQINITRAPGKDLAAGTYKVNIVKHSNNYGEKFITTASFKVVRGKKTGLALGSKSYTLVNRDYGYTEPVYITVKDSGVNEITNVTIGKGYTGKYRIEQVEDGVYKLGFAPGYVEKSKKKAITKQVTKKNVPIQIFYNGSSVADTVKVNVITLP